MQDIVDLYPGFSAEGFWNQLPLAKVGNLTVYEKTYKGGLVDLGSKSGEFALTLWYTASGSITPALAEVSFSYGDGDEQYTGKVVGNAILKRPGPMPPGRFSWIESPRTEPGPFSTPAMKPGPPSPGQKSDLSHPAGFMASLHTGLAVISMA